MTGNAQAMFFSLLRTGLWGRHPEAGCFPDLSSAEWKEVLSMADRQTVSGVTFCALETLPEVRPPHDVAAAWAAKAEITEQRNLKMNSAIGNLYSYFSSHGLFPVLQKGQGIASLYRRPLSRECGDIDFWFRDAEAKKKADDMIRGKGINVQDRPDGSSCYMSGGFIVEHHLRLYDIYNPFVQRYVRKLSERLALEETGIPGGRVLTPAPEHNLLMLYSHVLKHCIGRGVGMRQLCDIAVACHAYRDRIDGNLFMDMCRRVGITRWIAMMNSFMTGYLGLPKSSLPCETVKTDAGRLLDIVLSGGNFGQGSTAGRNSDATGFRRKIHTAMAFCRNSPFSVSLAPGETAGIVLMLLSGQV